MYFSIWLRKLGEAVADGIEGKDRRGCLALNARDTLKKVGEMRVKLRNTGLDILLGVKGIAMCEKASEYS